MNRIDFIKKIKGNNFKDSRYDFNLDFENKPFNKEIEVQIKNVFPIPLNEKQLSFFKISPDWGFMEDNEDCEGWRYYANVDLNELYDVIIDKQPNNIKDIIKIYRIENSENQGVYSVGLGYSLLNPGEAPHKDGNISFVFRAEVTDYMKKWNFGFKNKSQIQKWLDISNKEKILKLENSGLNLVEIKINKNKIVEGKEQVIFKQEDVLSRTKVNIENILNEKKDDYFKFKKKVEF